LAGPVPWHSRRLLSLRHWSEDLPSSNSIQWDLCRSGALVQVSVPVNKFPDFVRYAVQRLQALCPTLGKKELAEVLARAGLHWGTTTLGRIRKERPLPMSPKPQTAATTRKVTAKRPNHVWHIDLTTAPTASAWWCSWIPFALPQCWPFCWWIALILD